ncbi:hypothetical protein Tco_0016485 [Tanacetum coccineum]
MDLNRFVVKDDMINYVLHKYGSNWHVYDDIADDILDDLLKREWEKQKRVKYDKRKVIIIESDISYNYFPAQTTSDEGSDHNPFQATSDESSDHKPFQVVKEDVGKEVSNVRRKVKGNDVEYSEEEVAEMMAETMEKYMSKTRADYGSRVARPKIEDKDNFELKGQFLKELRTNTFSGSDHEDLRNEPTGSITTWDGLKTIFLNKYYPPARTAKKIEEINNFQQEHDENLYQAWERFKELLMKYPQHYLTEMQEAILFYNGLDIPTRQILDSRGAIPSKTAADAKKIGGDEIEVSDDESSNLEEYWSDKEETTEIFKIETDVFDHETPLCLAFNKFNYLLKVYDKPWLDNGIWKEPKPVKHTCKPFNYKTGCLEWPTCSWREDGYCNGGNLPGAYHIGNSLYYQDLEWYEALEDNELKDEALRNKAIIEGLISDNESSNNCWKRWKSHETYYHDYDEGEYENETHKEGHELCGIKTREVPVFQIKRYKMIKYSFKYEEEYVSVKEDEYDDLTITSEEACRAY